jgi:hypothetical protein
LKVPIIDTLEALGCVQQALERCGTDGRVHDPELYRTACSALSAIVPYLRQPKAPVQTKHYEAVQDLYKAMGK